MNVFISGKINDNPNFMEDFAKAEEKLKAKGYNVINPTKASNLLEYFDYADFMINSFILMKKCQAVYFLANWEDSTSSQIEKMVAKKIGLKILHEKYFGRQPNKNKNQIKTEEIDNDTE